MLQKNTNGVAKHLTFGLPSDQRRLEQLGCDVLIHIDGLRQSPRLSQLINYRPTWYYQCKRVWYRITHSPRKKHPVEARYVETFLALILFTHRCRNRIQQGEAAELSTYRRSRSMYYRHCSLVRRCLWMFL